MKKISITGHLGNDSKIVESKEKDFTTIHFSVAHTEKYLDKDSKEQENTDWFTCFKRYRKDPEKVLDILKKGTKVYVDGKPSFGLQTFANGQGVYPSITINVNNLDFMTKKQVESETNKS